MGCEGKLGKWRKGNRSVKDHFWKCVNGECLC